MDAENKPAENVPAAGVAGDSTRWRLILLVLCAVGAGLLIVILVLQFTEYRFYKASPGVWPAPHSLGDGGPQPGAGGTVSAPATFTAPAAATITPSGSVSSTMPATATALEAPSAATTAAPSEAATSSGVTSTPAVAATGAPVAATP